MEGPWENQRAGGAEDGEARGSAGMRGGAVGLSAQNGWGLRGEGRFGGPASPCRPLVKASLIAGLHKYQHIKGIVCWKFGATWILGLL